MILLVTCWLFSCMEMIFRFVSFKCRTQILSCAHNIVQTPSTWDSRDLMCLYCNLLVLLCVCSCFVLYTVLVLSGVAQISCTTGHSSCSQAALHVLQMGHSVLSQSSTSHIRHHSVKNMQRKWCVDFFFFFWGGL